MVAALEQLQGKQEEEKAQQKKMKKARISGIERQPIRIRLKALEKDSEMGWRKNAGDHLEATGREPVQWCHQEFFGPKSKIPSVQGGGGRRSFTNKTFVCLRTSRPVLRQDL